MSYCRTGPDSDVYVIGTKPEDEVVWQCFSGPDHFYEAPTRQAMVEHLDGHVLAGDKVPGRVFDRLYREIDAMRG